MQLPKIFSEKSRHTLTFPKGAGLRNVLLNIYSYLIAIILLPVLLVQGVLVKIRTPILPEASGTPHGLINGRGEPVCLIVLGESTVAGVGVNTYDKAMACQTALVFGEKTCRSISWHAVGRVGMMVKDLRREYLHKVASMKADIIMLSLGVNDALHMRSPRTYYREMNGLVRELNILFKNIPIVIAPVAPLGYFPGIPQPLRYVLGLRARVLDRAAARVPDFWNNVYHCPTPTESELIKACFARDGFHPGPLGYAILGNILGGFLSDSLRTFDKHGEE